MINKLTAGELIGCSIRNRPELKRQPDKLARYLLAEHNLHWRDAAQIALRLANEPEWIVFPPIRQIELILTQGCNLKCDYCFVGDQSDRTISPTNAQLAIDFLLRESADLHEVHVTFFGGEPMLAWRRIKELVLYGETAAAKKSKVITWGMTTNGTLIDEEALKFFHEHGIHFLLSDYHRTSASFSNLCGIGSVRNAL